MTVELGITLPQFTDDAARFRDAAATAEEAGLDSIWVFDHMWPLTGGRERPALEAWTSLAWLATATSTIKIGTLVTRSSLRHPALLAKMAATVAEVAPGRLIVGIGSGDEKSRGENEAFGFPYWSEEDRVDQLRSTVELVLRFFEAEPVDQSDDFVSVRALPPSPRPDARPDIWVAGRADDTLDVAASLGDGWNGWGGTPARFTTDLATVLEMAEDRFVLPTWGGVVPSSAPPDQVVERLGGLVAAGARHLVVTFSGAWSDEAVRRLASDVRPALR